MRQAGFVFSLFLMVTPHSVEAATLLVPSEFPTIRKAVKAASAGDTVSVSTGAYGEKVRIKHLDNLTLIADGIVLIAPGSGSSAIVVRSSKGVRVEGFVVNDASYAVRLGKCENTTVIDNTIEGTGTGIRVIGGSGNIIKSNEIVDLTGFVDEFGFIDGGHGVRIRRSSGNEVRANAIRGAATDPVGNGVLVSRGSGTIVQNNDLRELGRNGIRLIRSPDSLLKKNKCLDNLRSGIHVNRSPDIEIDQNTAAGNGNVGIAVFRSEDLTVTSNVAEANERFGIRVNRSNPLTMVSDLINDGNNAVDNAVANYRVGDERE